LGGASARASGVPSNCDSAIEPSPTPHCRRK
jgi:hypothetical protein